MRTNEVIGLIPCAGHATRITPLPCSKEVLPVGLGRTSEGFLRPKVVSHYLLEKMRRGGVSKAFFILRKGKWDIPQYYGNGAAVGMDLGYLVTDRTYGPPYTLDEALSVRARGTRCPWISRHSHRTRRRVCTDLGAVDGDEEPTSLFPYTNLIRFRSQT